MTKPKHGKHEEPTDLNVSGGTCAQQPVTQSQFAAQEKLFRELLQTQEANFKSFIQIFVDSTNKRVDDFLIKVTQEISELKTSLEFSQKDLDDITSSVQAAKNSPSVSPEIMTSG